MGLFAIRGVVVQPDVIVIGGGIAGCATALNLARVLRNESRIAEAKAAAKEALAKGVKKPKDANAILALPGGK